MNLVVPRSVAAQVGFRASEDDIRDSEQPIPWHPAFGDVSVVPSQFKNQTGTKRGPAVVVSSDAEVPTRKGSGSAYAASGAARWAMRTLSHPAEEDARRLALALHPTAEDPFLRKLWLLPGQSRPQVFPILPVAFLHRLPCPARIP
jgi:hypothetical protein